MNVSQAICKLEELRDLGHGDRPLIVDDTRSGVTEELSSISVRTVDPQRGQGWECDAEEGAVYVALYI